MPQASILTAVFSYNRPKHLANCLRSIRDMYPDADVVVYDDNSPDKNVAKVAAEYNVPLKLGAGGAGRHGGLYANMQMAYEDAIAGGYDYLFSVQDDLQMVRPVTDRTMQEIKHAFDEAQSVFCLNVEFARTVPEGGQTNFALPSADAPPAPFRDYLDVSLFHVQRMQAAGWSFELDLHMVVSGEKSLSLRASEMGLRRNVVRTPFLMHVPFPDLYRNRIRLPRLSALRGGIFRYEYMSKADMDRMDARPAAQVAQWRDYLRVENANWFDRWLMSTKHDAKILQ